MNVVAKHRRRVNGFDDVAREIVGMRSHKADASNSGDFCNGAEQFDEAHVPWRGIAIRVDSLAEELDFGVAAVDQAPDFVENRGAGATALRTARVRHDAISARVVAALDDGQISAEGIVAGGNFGFECFLRVEGKTSDAAAARFQLREHLGQFAITCRAADHAHPRRATEDFLAFLLREAAENADDLFFAERAAKIAEARKNFLRGLLANAARVVENEISGGGRVHLLISARSEER